MTDNFNAYKQFITEKWSYSDLPEGDSYFAVELIRRGKDNPDLSAANYHFKNYYIRKPEDLDKYKQEIIDLCLFVASEKGQFINGENIMIDGGRNAMGRWN